MSKDTATLLTDLLQVKKDVKDALIEQGVDLTDKTFEDLAELILEIEGGSSGSGDFFTDWLFFVSADTVDDKIEAMDYLDFLLNKMDRADLLALSSDYRDENELWADEPIILGVLGEPASDSQLTRYEDNSYEIDPQLITEGNYNYYVWDDTKWPFNEMQEVVDTYGNTFIRIPKMYIKLVKTGTTVNERYISNEELDGYELPKCFINHENNEELDYILVSKYLGHKDGSNRFTSKSSVEPLGNTKLEDFRTYANNNNANGESGYQLFDMHIKFVLETLYLIVFANTDSDSLFPQGATGSKQNNGTFDNFGHHTGYTTGLTNYLMTFLGIENYFSNMLCQVDGVKINNKVVYVCDNPANYNSNENTTDYSYIGNTPQESGNISGLGCSQGLFTIPILQDGTTVYETYYCDRFSQDSGYRTVYFGRLYNAAADFGLFYVNAYYTLVYVCASNGSRLIKKPLP